MMTTVVQAASEHHGVPEPGILEKYQRPEILQSLRCAQFLIYSKQFTEEDKSGDKISPNPKYLKLLRCHQNK